MNILMIYPKFPDTFWSFKHALGFIGKKSSMPPLGLLTVASLLPGSWQKRLIDLNVESLPEKCLAWADMVFLSSMAIQRESAMEIIGRCKREGVPVVAGGPFPSSEPGEFYDADYLVLDEAEMTLPTFIRDLTEGRPRRVYKAEGFCDLTATPAPMWSLIRMEKYASMTVQFSRGCPFNCEFCSVTVLFGNEPRMKTPGQLIVELDGLYEAGWRGSIFLVDDNFIGNKKYIKKELLPELVEWRKGKLGCAMFTEASINLADDGELLDLMANAGFDSVFIGIESPDEACLAECRKVQNSNRNLLDNVRTIQRAGIEVLGGFIVGFDSDTQASFGRLVEFIQKSGIVSAMVGILQAPHGTRLFDRLSREKRLLGSTSGDNVDGTTNIIPKMGIDSLLAGYRSIVEHIYSPSNFYERIREFLQNAKIPKVRYQYDMSRISAFVKSLFWLGIWGRERLNYWRLIIWTVLHHPKLLPRAITLAIYGYHFRRIVEQI